MIRTYIIPILMLLLLITCEDRERSNPVDPNADPDAWAPANLQVFVISDSEIKLTWTQEEEQISGFRIGREAGIGSFSQIAEVEKDVREYTDIGLNYGTDYTYRVQAFTDDNESGYATSNTTTMSIPTPTTLTATPLNDTDIQLTWNDNCSFENGYRIERSQDAVTFIQIAEVNADVIEYTDMGMALGTDYTYRVQAFTDENKSDYVETTVNFWQDCNGGWGGTAVEDCNGDCDGTAVEDCNGDCGSTAFENECGYCVGGNTGLDVAYCGIVTDIDGNEYNAIIIGNQIWMGENLQVTHYRDGSDIPLAPLIMYWWSSTNSGAYCVYEVNPSNAETYGNLYNWYAVNDIRNIAPEGWHVATDAEWTTLTTYLGGTSVAGGKLKEAGTVHWNSPNTGATNESGFTARPGGYRDGFGWGEDIGMGECGYFWSSSEDNSISIGGFARSLRLYSTNSEGYQASHFYTYGLSVRCVRD